MGDPVLVIQGGAGKRSTPERRTQVAASLRRIGAQAFRVLGEGGSAVEAVVEAVRLLEDDPLYNAGTGSKLQADGVPRLSAALMDGHRERFSGVVNVEGLANPILLCPPLLEARDQVLAGEGALALARELGLPEKDVRTERAIRLWREAQAGETGTVGAVALDGQGRLAAATSTGGRGMERVGRVSDTPTVAGNYASSVAATSLTGIGEEIVDGALAVRLVAAVEAGAGLKEAGEALVARMGARRQRAGFIAVDATGAWTVGLTTEAMSWRAITAAGAWDFTAGG